MGQRKLSTLTRFDAVSRVHGTNQWVKFILLPAPSAYIKGPVCEYSMPSISMRVGNLLLRGGRAYTSPSLAERIPLGAILLLMILLSLRPRSLSAAGVANHLPPGILGQVAITAVRALSPGIALGAKAIAWPARGLPVAVMVSRPVE